MLQIYRQSCFRRTLFTTSCKCVKDDLKNPKLAAIKEQIEEDKKRLQWKTPYADQPGTFESAFKLFSSNNRNSELLERMQQPIDVSPKAIKKWWSNRKDTIEAHMQKFIPERHASLGDDLAAAHFVVHRGGAVRFLGQKDWIQMDEEDDYDLPRHYDPNWVLEQIKCDNIDLFYDGLENIRRLRNLKSLSFENVKRFDDWYLDRVSGSGFPALEHLNLKGTAVTERGLNCLYRLPSLRTVFVDEPEKNVSWKLTIAMLEEWNPNMSVRSA
ncbi:distal membrane-arm assembly complex protein 2 [Uranotaenia lowii]|uniref:distal membrane-arm assembly complex protein 2 n=1 Tax=Uranotaenia lowii TaxID=190385 RepID=UPI002479E7B9|nr:distal membrane-arm assembly complex protein 2 [Uranotaenia lowii]